MPIYDFHLYKKMYHVLFNAITDALRLLPENHPAARILKQTQRQTEEMYITQGEDP